MDSEEIFLRRRFIDVLKSKGRPLKKEVIDGLVKEHNENKRFVQFNKLTVYDLPTKEELYSDFIDPVTEDCVGKFCVDIDSICLDDSLGMKIFKEYHDWSWKSGDSIPNIIIDMIKINITSLTSTNKTTRNNSKIRIANLAMVGVVRLNNLERKPYFTSSEMSKSIDYFKNCLMFLNGILKGKYNDETLIGNLYIFDSFNIKKGLNTNGT